MGRKPSFADDWLIYLITIASPYIPNTYYVALSDQVWRREHSYETNKPEWRHMKGIKTSTLTYMINRPDVYSLRLVTKDTHPYVTEVIRELETVIGTQP